MSSRRCRAHLAKGKLSATPAANGSDTTSRGRRWWHTRQVCPLLVGNQPVDRPLLGNTHSSEISPIGVGEEKFVVE